MGEEREKNRTNVTIYNQPYTIVGDESSEHIQEVAALIDTKMKELKHYNPYLDSTKLAVLTAVNIGNDYLSILKKLEDEKKDED
ncbi:cell division protein ZapA [Salipaludibacillus agaradhaerens]|uniref:Cell division protein ZapA n=1 Tax=Salipaludibacillus agaradhaerens TaxID=76935 RepID=A0A9Q4FVE2_SALAG|nr:cell division protein ZapA [Salipaludibacillus agaradhaerens]MCR6095580.1 cell division protein ZapA [Salipaludibacillus agaradhaerens]MCR6114860.1 cell division protein ZapA [Salipaludibacillus agaradhaerens]